MGRSRPRHQRPAPNRETRTPPRLAARARRAPLGGRGKYEFGCKFSTHNPDEELWTVAARRSCLELMIRREL